MVPWNSTSGGFAFIWQSKWIGIPAIKTERKPIHFSSDVLVAVASLHVKVRNRFYSYKRDLSTDCKYLFPGPNAYTSTNGVLVRVNGAASFSGYTAQKTWFCLKNCKKLTLPTKCIDYYWFDSSTSPFTCLRFRYCSSLCLENNNVETKKTIKWF